MEKSSVRKGYFNVLAMFSVRFWFESGKICKNNDIGYFIKSAASRVLCNMFVDMSLLLWLNFPC